MFYEKIRNNELERLKVSRFEIIKEFIELLLNLERLEQLDFFGCVFKDVDFLKLNGKIKNISFSTCQELHFGYSKVEIVNVVRKNIILKYKV